MKPKTDYKRKDNFHKKNYLGYINKNNQDEIYTDSESEILYINNINNTENPNEKFTTWIYDTGAADHITNNKNILSNFIEKKIKMKYIAKNLISGIKLEQAGITCKINNKNYKPQLEIRNKENLIFKTRSETTLIAAEETNRRCFMMELEPKNF
ncbi:hypothetical protein PIROE2DRAFT_14819 [Piromyces sp. E2]|nr:hypothetical protein PIROE2DRAFT_14819 [Piromyces sp. E2]|eukprot:OUM59595.1 hypothetical protein PIROE2DRAFT_14819 [Piromyces sp. E2]